MEMNGEDPNKDSGNSTRFLEKQWVRRVRERGDRSAFKNIFEAYYKCLHGFARSFVGSNQKAEDIVQSVFLSIWAKRKRWDPPGTLKSYLFNAVKNESLNVLRHEKVVDKTEDEVARKFKELKKSDLDRDDEYVKKLRKDIEEAIDELPPRCRQIFMLNRRSGLTYAEIAQILDLSIGTINTQMGRALKKLRNHLSDYISVGVLAGISDMFYKLFFILIFISIYF